MPKCSLCGKVVTDKNALRLLRSEDGRWIAHCDDCSSQVVGDPIESVAAEPPPPAPSPEDKPAPEFLLPEGPATEPPPPAPRPRRRTLPQQEGTGVYRRPKAVVEREARQTKEIFDRMRRRLVELKRAEKRDQSPHAYRRESERYVANLLMRFTMLRDDQVYAGRVLDISRGGMRFLTQRPLDKGQIVCIEVGNARGNDPLVALLQSGAEVRRVKQVEEDRYEVGVRFVTHGRTHAENRRRHRRHDVDFSAYYLRTGSEITYRGEVGDISQGGVRFLLDEGLEQNEQLAIMLRAESDSFMRADLRGIVRVCRLRQIDKRRYEAGCAFVKVRLLPRSGGRGRNAAAS